MIKGILFDFAGTIADTLRLCIAGFRQAIEPLAGRTVSDQEIIATFGPSEEGTTRQLAPHACERGIAAYLKAYRELHGLCPAPFPGIVELLHELRLRGILTALVTGKGASSCRISLEYYGIADCFDRIQTGSPAGPVKPQCIRAVLAELALTPQEALYVGDSASDIQAAREVGVETLAAAWATTADIQELQRQQPLALFSTVAGLRNYLLA